MDYLSKVQTVRENIQDLQKENGNEFSYVITGFCMGDEITEASTLVSPTEEREIIQYLSRRKFLEILTEGQNSFNVKILPKRNPTIKLKTLELIARELKDCYSGTEIIAFLKSCGVNEKFIVYPDSKWSIFYRVFQELTLSGDEKAKNLLFRILLESIHPLNLDGDKEKSEALVKKFNGYLEYDNLEISNADPLHHTIKQKIISPEETYQYEEFIQAQDSYAQDLFEQQEKDELMLLRQPKAVEAISRLRKNYQTLMNLVEVFCQNPSKPTTELNRAYTQLKTTIFHTISSIGLLGQDFLIYDFSKHNSESYNIPFSNLFSAEKDFREKRIMLSWDSIRPKMNAMYGEIDSLYQAANASDVLSQPDNQTQINEIMLMLSEIKKRNEESAALQYKKDAFQLPVQKIEITAMPELKVKNVEDETLVKGKKRISLPKFPSTEWSKVEIRFLDENTVHLTAGKKTTTVDYEGLGFRNDKNGKPDTAWHFLLELAQNKGETKAIPSPIPDNIKQHKRTLSDRLKTIFKNDTDPFYDFSESKTYKAKFKLIPYANKERSDGLGIEDYLNETMTSEYETEG